jgi:hypothetical protein
MNIKEAINYYVLNKLEIFELPEIATQALVDGYDSESLRILAGETNPSMSNSLSLFEKVLKELKITIPTKDQARLNLINDYAKCILEDDLDPNEGAKKIYEIGSESDAIMELVSIFEELSWSYESDEPLKPFNWLTKDQIIEKIREEAKKLQDNIIETM